jgi:hypothetical protein
MEKNVYAPPGAELKEVIERTPRPKTAIVVAALFDITLTIVMTAVVGIGYGIYLVSTGSSPEEIQSAAQTMTENTGFRAITSFLGLLVSIMAGYLCAHLAVRNVYRNAALCGVLLTLFVRLVNLEPKLTLTDLALVAVSFMALLFGAWLYVRRQA